MAEYFYSEGYVYAGENTICKMYGTPQEQEHAGNIIVKLLNGETLKEAYNHGFTDTRFDFDTENYIEL